jgi:hypothetical protein
VVRVISAASSGAAVIARATVERVDAFEATATLDMRGGGGDAAASSEADDLVAYPRVRALPPLAVRCTGDLDARARLAGVPWLRVIDDDGSDARLAGAGSPISVERVGDRWTIADGSGPLRAAPVPAVRGGPGTIVSGADSLDAVIDALADLAAVAALRALATSAASPSAPRVAARLHRLAASGVLDLAISADEVLTPGEVSYL